MNVAKLIFNFNFNLIERLDGYILNIPSPSHPPTGEVRNDLWNEAYNIFNLSLFCINFVLVHPPTHQANSDKLQLHLQIPFQLQV